MDAASFVVVSSLVVVCLMIIAACLGQPSESDTVSSDNSSTGSPLVAESKSETSPSENPAEPPAKTTIRLTSEPVANPSAVPPAQYGGGNVWWFGVALGLLAGLASAAAGGGRAPEGAIVAFVLNPLVWFGGYSLFKIRPTVRCPHCRRTETISAEFRNARLGSIAICPHCGNEFQKVT